MVADPDQLDLDAEALAAWEAINAQPALDLPGLRRLIDRSPDQRCIHGPAACVPAAGGSWSAADWSGVGRAVKLVIECQPEQVAAIVGASNFACCHWLNPESGEYVDVEWAMKTAEPAPSA